MFSCSSKVRIACVLFVTCVVHLLNAQSSPPPPPSMNTSLAVDNDAATAWTGTTISIAFTDPVVVVGYAVTAFVGGVPQGWTLRGVFSNGTTVVLSSVPISGLVPSGSVSLGVQLSNIEVASVELECTTTCTIAELEIRGIPVVQPPWISAPSYASDVYFGSNTTGGIRGEYVQTAASGVPTSYTFTTSFSGVPTGLALLASSDGGGTFAILDTCASSLVADASYTFALAQTQSYGAYRLVCTSTLGPSCWIGDFSISASGGGSIPAIGSVYSSAAEARPLQACVA